LVSEGGGAEVRWASRVKEGAAAAAVAARRKRRRVGMCGL
jgi:hypothetical protein